MQGRKQSSAFWTVQPRLSLRLTILEAHDSKHFCYIFRTAAKDCTCWKNCWFLITAGSSHVLHSVLPHHTEHWTCAKPWRATLHIRQTPSTQPGNHSPSAPRKESALKPYWYLSSFRILQHLPQHVQRMFTTKVKFKKGEVCPGCPTSQWANEILTRTDCFSPQAVFATYSLWLKAFCAHLSSNQTCKFKL